MSSVAALQMLPAEEEPDPRIICDTGSHPTEVASQERCKWRRGAAPWWSMLGRDGGGLVDRLGVST